MRQPFIDSAGQNPAGAKAVKAAEITFGRKNCKRGRILILPEVKRRSCRGIMKQELRKKRADMEAPEKNGPDQMRLNRFLSASGVCSRREADRLIGAGRVTVNGNPVSLGTVVREGDRVSVDGKRVEPAKKEIFLAVNKPAGVVVTTDRSRGDLTLEDMVHYPERVFAVGRLDKDSEGLILMTNNGEASNLIQKARGRHEKEYQVTVDRPYDRDFLRKMGAGVYLEELDRTTRPCEVRPLDQNSFDIILTEGLNRQIRRMCLTLGYRVRKLKRIRVMNIKLGSLKEGACRELTEEELRVLKKDLGLQL